MPKYSTFPTLFNQLLQFSTKDLKALKYFNGLSYKGGVINWERNKQTTASISIKVNTISDNPFIELDYKANDKPLNYKINLVSIPSNLGKGIVWYFICPNTGRKCRKLYLANEYFVSRYAFINVMYEKQTESHKWRNWRKTIGKVCESEKLFEQIESKYFKRSYGGQPTKRFIKLWTQIKAAEKISESGMMNIFKL
ncbi:MAG TPA: hypothetical protein VIJ75_18695 [Hanamia sp.]